ncbi:hypothetical protein [Nonomuraea sp. KM88]|uniref:hypothetical protein n=1 Tax=Nonomuraea sp. KM88 TaxID=3457427 RepID=UPI003FCE408B
MADRMPRVVRATRLTLVSFAVGLALVAASVIAGGNWGAGYQYAAAAAFVLAWEAIRFGVWKSPDEEKRWLRAALIDTGKVMGLLLSVALAGAFITQLNDAVEQSARTASTAEDGSNHDRIHVRANLELSCTTTSAGVRNELISNLGDCECA